MGKEMACKAHETLHPNISVEYCAMARRYCKRVLSPQIADLAANPLRSRVGIYLTSIVDGQAGIIAKMRAGSEQRTTGLVSMNQDYDMGRKIE
jgi:hypothetical protein